jgi:hypothetical protein
MHLLDQALATTVGEDRRRQAQAGRPRRPLRRRLQRRR